MQITKLDKTSETVHKCKCGSLECDAPMESQIWQHYEVSHVHYATPHSEPIKLIVGEFRATIKNFNQIVFEEVN